MYETDTTIALTCNYVSIIHYDKNDIRTYTNSWDKWAIKYRIIFSFGLGFIQCCTWWCNSFWNLVFFFPETYPGEVRVCKLGYNDY